MIAPTRTWIIATRNAGKVKEFAKWFSPLGIDVKSLADVSTVPDIEEDGDTFLANAEKKAKVAANILHTPVIADDSGLCVEAIDGEPGVYSARYAGESATDNEKLLRVLTQKREAGNYAAPELAGEHPNLLSSAYFTSTLVFVDPETETAIHAEGRVYGYILEHPRGENGFGYDPLFYLPELGRSMAELTVEEKNQVSHRANALRELHELLVNREETGEGSRSSSRIV